MNCEVKLRTGYFKTAPYNMIITDNKIILSSLTDHKDDITISNIDLLILSGIENKNSEFEIQSNDNIYQCMLHDDIDFDMFISTIRKELNINKAIICNARV